MRPPEEASGLADSEGALSPATPVFDARTCEECGKDIGPDDAYVEIDIASDSPEEPAVRTVRLHPGDCLTRFRLKHPVRPAPSEVTRVKRKKQK